MALLYRMGTGNGSGSDLKPYIVQFTCDSGYIGQTLTMTYKGTPHAGETVDNVSGTVVSDGTKGALTLYPMHSGNWECSCYSSVTGTTMKKTIELSYWGTTNVEFNDIPDGATVTPTNDTQTWLHCANIWDKTNLTTIDDVIADTTTLNTLIANENASDYLVRSTTWASDVCNNESAMTYIGLNDYCANKLLADSTWLEAICNAKDSSGNDLFEKVLTTRVPTLNQDTDNVQASSSQGSYYKYKIFDGQNSQGSNHAWSPKEYEGSSGKAWIQYKFENPTSIKKLHIVQELVSPRGVKDFEILASNNGTDFTTKLEDKNGNTTFTAQNLTDGTVQYFNVVNNQPYYYYRLHILSTYKTQDLVICQLQFYGREA